MMTYFLATVLSIFLVELFLNLPFRTALLRTQTTIRKSNNVIRSPRISDHWKEKVILRYSKVVFSQSLRLLLYLMVIAGAVFGVKLLNDDLFPFLISPIGLGYVTVISLLYGVFRIRQSKQEYGLHSKILHYIALGSPSVAEASYDFEQLSNNIPDVRDGKHVFICGLARAGTTLILRRFYASNKYASLTYRNMPFVLMPNLWDKISAFSKNRALLKERAHGDGLQVSFDSPEAIEEVFWRVFSGDRYIHEDKLTSMEEAFF